MRSPRRRLNALFTDSNTETYTINTSDFAQFWGILPAAEPQSSEQATPLSDSGCLHVFERRPDEDYPGARIFRCREPACRRLKAIYDDQEEV